MQIVSTPRTPAIDCRHKPITLRRKLGQISQLPQNCLGICIIATHDKLDELRAKVSRIVVRRRRIRTIMNGIVLWPYIAKNPGDESNEKSWPQIIRLVYRDAAIAPTSQRRAEAHTDFRCLLGSEIFDPAFEDIERSVCIELYENRQPHPRPFIGVHTLSEAFARQLWEPSAYPRVVFRYHMQRLSEHLYIGVDRT